MDTSKSTFEMIITLPPLEQTDDNSSTDRFKAAYLEGNFYYVYFSREKSKGNIPDNWRPRQNFARKCKPAKKQRTLEWQ